MEKLAIQGGPQAVTVPARDRWVKIGEEEVQIVTEMVRRGEVSTPGGGVAGEFEKIFAEFIGRKYCLGQNCGTSTLHSAYYAAGVGPGDEVVVPSYTWCNTILPIFHTNGIPVFCEVNPKTLTADPEDIRRKITKKTKAICVVHLWGNVADMDAIMAISKETGVKVIEDCSHAHGAEYKGKKVGSIGHIGCFSLQGSKPVSAGEGGVILCDDPDILDRIAVIGHQGRVHTTIVGEKYRDLYSYGFGWKYRAHPLGMGMATVQLKRLPELNKRRLVNFAKLDAAFKEIPGLTPTETSPGSTRGGMYEYHAMMVPSELNGISQDRFIEILRAEGVPVNPCRYPLLHVDPIGAKQINIHDEKKCPWNCPHVENKYKWGKGSLPVTEDVYGRLLGMPAYTDPEEGLLDQIIEGFRKVTSAIRAGEIS